MRLTVVGTGYVGLVTGTCFAEMGNQVTCVDIDQDKVKMMKSGQIPIYENGLDELFHKNQKQGRLLFTSSLEEGIADAEIIFLALPTPPGADGAADLNYVLGVAGQLGSLLTHYTIIVDKSTVPVGTAEKVHQEIAKNAKVEFDVVSNPEFLREGLAIEDFMKPERVIIGAESLRAQKIMEQLYAPFVRQGNPIYFMDIRSAELTKYAANAFLATKISFMNEIANLCEQVGANVDEVRKGLGSDSRIGKRFLFPGIGYGGSCFPKDVQALAHSANQVGYRFHILDAVMRVNDNQRTKLIPLIIDHFKNDLKDKVIAVWGLAFKPQTDDIREAPALNNVRIFLQHGAKVRVHDPEAMENVKKIFGDQLTYHDLPMQAAEGADLLFIATEWQEFRSPDFERLGKVMNQKVIFDGRNLYDVEVMREKGFKYVSIGRKPIL